MIRMKIKCLLLLFLMLWSGSAAAGETMTDGVFDYRAGDPLRMGSNAVVIDGYHLAEGQTELFIPEKWNGMPVFVEGETIPEQVEVVYTPWENGVINPAEGRTLTEVFYVSGKDARIHYSDRVSDSQDDDIVLMSVERYSTRGSETLWEAPAYLAAEKVPAELDGRRVNVAALDKGVFAELTGECRHNFNYGVTNIVDAELPDGAAEIVVPTDFTGEPIVQIWMGAFDGDIRTICLPYGVYGQLVQITRGTAYCIMYYADYDMVMGDPALRQAFPDMGMDDYALVENQVALAYDHQDSVWTMRVGFDPETLPKKLRGHRLLMHPSLNENAEILDFQRLYRAELDAEMADWFGLSAETEAVAADETVYTRNELLYMLDHSQQIASIVDYALAEEQTELFVPARIDGYVVNIEYENVPQQISTLWISEDCLKTFWNFGDKPKNFERLTYEYAQTAEDSITLKKAILDVWDAEGQYTDKNRFIETDALPETIAGNRILFIPENQAPIVEGVYHAEYQGPTGYAQLKTNEWIYNVSSYPDGRKEAQIIGSTLETTEKILFIPESLSGCTVTTVDLAAIPESVEIVCMKGDGSSLDIVQNEPSDRNLHVAIYTDWEGAGSPKKMEKDELTWIRCIYKDFATEDSAWSLEHAIHIDTLPKEINGKKVILLNNDNPEFYFVSGDWRYTFAMYNEQLLPYLTHYQGEQDLETLYLPAKIDGYTVGGVEATAIPESVKVVYSNGSVSISNHYRKREGSLLQVSYLDYTAYQQKSWRDPLPEGTTRDDLRWDAVLKWTFGAECSTSEQGQVNVSVLPAEINGQRVVAPYSFSYTYTSGGWEYYLYAPGQNSAASAWIFGSDFPEGTGEMTVPRELDGHPVIYIDYSAIPETVRKIHVPKGCFVREKGEKIREYLKVVEYR